MDANEVTISDDAQVTEVATDISTFDTIRRNYATYVFQAQGDSPEMDKGDRNYYANGGRFQPPLISKGREECADF